ncbi:hypothetical protein EW146_g10282, partial [Bondarzewia mesenterica]
DPPPPPTPFEALLASEELPPTGPDLFAARRALWLTPPPTPPIPTSPSPSRIRLHDLLNQPGALESNEVWQAGLNKVWKGLVSGGRLRKLLPLNLVVKILYAGWIRDGTWPESAAAVDNDEFFSSENVYVLPPRIPPHISSAPGRSTSGHPSDSTSVVLGDGSGEPK